MTHRRSFVLVLMRFTTTTKVYWREQSFGAGLIRLKQQTGVDTLEVLSLHIAITLFSDYSKKR